MSDNVIVNLDSINRKLMSLTKPEKPKMLVVDDESDNLDLLYRTFRRDFQVLRADSGGAALELLSTEGEVAVIISDQRMPEMKGAKQCLTSQTQSELSSLVLLTLRI